MTLLLGRQPYRRRVLGTRLSGLIAYWPLNELSGSTAADASGNSRTGAYTACTLAQPGIGDGRTAISLDGSTSVVNVHTASLAAAWNGAAGTVTGFLKADGAGVWSDLANTRRPATIRVNSSNSVHVRRTTNADELLFNYSAGGVNSTVTATGLTSLDWLHVAITWDKAADEMRGYVGGIQVGTTQTGLGVWAGSLNSAGCVLGAQTTGPLNVWLGSLAHWAVWNVALSAAEVAMLARR